MKVLVIEDNPLNMKLTAEILSMAGHEVLEAADAVTGIEMARSERPALIVMDIQLPGMDGMTATRILKADACTRHIKILALTAMTMKGDEERILAAGCDGYVSKPFQYRVLLQTVESLTQPEP